MRLIQDWEPVIRARVCVEAKAHCECLRCAIQPRTISSAQDASQHIALAAGAQPVLLGYTRAHYARLVREAIVHGELVLALAWLC